MTQYQKPELYHWEPNANSLRPIICLREKGVDFHGRFVDVLNFEQYQPDFLRLSPRGTVPVLVHEGNPYYETSYIEQYIEEVFPGAALMPDDAVGRWRVRVWQKRVDEDLAPAVSMIAWNRFAEDLLKGREKSALQEAVACIHSQERRDVWTAAIANQYSGEQLKEAHRKIGGVVDELEARLAHAAWANGGAYTLADGALFAFINYLPHLLPDSVNTTTTPATLAWLDRMSTRPAVKDSLKPIHCRDPFTVIAPGPEPIRWG